MSWLPRLRITFYLLVITTHVGSALYMGWYSRQNEDQPEEAQVFKSLEYRFFTTWTYMLQIGYSLLGIICDSLLLQHANDKNYKLPPAIGDFREIIYAGLVWPSTWVVFTVFWGLYSIDRALVYPKFLDQVIPWVSNHVMHTFILPVALFELVCRPRVWPENHARNVAQLTLHLCVYLSVLLFTYKERGIWLYPIFRKLYGTIYFPLALAGIGVLFYVFYYMQWPLTHMIHGHNPAKKTQKTEKKLDKKKKVK